MAGDVRQQDLIGFTASVVAAYVTGNKLIGSDLPGLIGSVHEAFARLSHTSDKEERPVPVPPAVLVRKSITPDFIICLEDGKRFKSMRRYLSTRYGLTPAQYREKWKLPADYPMVAPNYAKARSELAKSLGLGQLRRKRPQNLTAEVKPAPAQPRSRAKRKSR